MPLPVMEMSIFETILARRSVRNYLSKNVDKATINSLLEAAVWAPTAMHREPWGFVTIQDKQLLLRLSDKTKSLYFAEAHHDSMSHFSQMFNSPDFNVFYDAGTLILICGNKHARFAEADCWLAAENLMLAACAMGLGTCVIGCAVTALNDAETKKILNITDDYIVIAPIIVGYQKGDPARSQRKSPVVLSRIS